MFSAIFYILKAIFFSIFLWIGCAFLGRLISKKFSTTLGQHIVMFIVAIISCILFISYFFTSYLHSTVKGYGQQIVVLTQSAQKATQNLLTYSGEDSSEYIKSIAGNMADSYPLIAGRIQKVVEQNNELQKKVEQILQSDAVDKANLITTCITENCYQGVLKKLFGVKMKLLIGLLIVQATQVVMIISAANKTQRRSSMPPFLHNGYFDN